MRRFLFSWLQVFALVLTTGTTWAIEIVVDYTYDTQNFFDQQVKRDALEAAAARFSRVITSTLAAVEPVLPDRQVALETWRIGFTHPGTGERIDLSTAQGVSDDPISEPAFAYGFPGLGADQWLLFAGGHNLTTAGIGGSGTGINFTDTFEDSQGPHHRGLIPVTSGDAVNDLPVWGGSVAFDTDTIWHFDLNTTADNSEVDFYSIALHEIGHALGLSTNWNQWRKFEGNSSFMGTNAVAAYNQDNGTSLSELSLVGGGDPHWEDSTYDSFIFPLGQPIGVGTVVAGKQDLLLEPTADFTSAVRRFELTNVDAAALVDLGWSILEPSSNALDLNGDNRVDGADVDLACFNGLDLSPYYVELGSLLGDANFDGMVSFPDFLVLSTHFTMAGDYTDGDFNCSGSVDFADFLILSNSFGASAAAAQGVPEPSALLIAFLCLLSAGPLRTSRSRSRWL